MQQHDCSQKSAGIHPKQGLKFKNKKDFGLKLRDDNLRAENTALVKGGFVVVDDRWVPYGDLRLDVQQLVAVYLSTASRRVFNYRGDVMYILLCVDGAGATRVVPSVAMNRKNYGDVKVFPSLSGLLPLMLVRLRHDGSEDLSAMLPVTADDVKVYTGYGNFTPCGVRGPTGLPGWTGLQGSTGYPGIVGWDGVTGIEGATGAQGLFVQGVTGLVGVPGDSVPAYQSSFARYVQDVVDSYIDGWQDSADDTIDTVQDIT